VGTKIVARQLSIYHVGFKIMVNCEVIEDLSL